VRKCAYCDFYSVAGRRESLDNYIDAVLREAGLYADSVIQTIYIGGGTPSLLSPTQLSRLLSGLYRVLNCSDVSETTIEVNPDSATPEFLRMAKFKGIDRISVGVQSMSNAELRSVGRVHNADQAAHAILEAKRIGFRNISADLIVGLPGQDRESLRFSLDALLRLDIQHVSLYCLSLEAGTPLELNPPADLPSDNEQADLYEFACRQLEEAGFIHYEISNFALSGFTCRHNLNYWRGGEYIGLGPAAATHLFGRRYKNKSDLDAYLISPTRVREEEEKLAPDAKAAEEAMLRLRLLREGLDISELVKRYSESSVIALRSRLQKLVDSGDLLYDGKSYRLFPERILTSNSVFVHVIAP